MLVLASSSPRRRELLTQAGFSFTVHPADICEDPFPNEDPVAYVSRLAREKAQAVYSELSAHAMPDDPLILSAPGPASGTWETTNPRSEPNSALCQGTTSQLAEKCRRSSKKCQGTTLVVPKTYQKEAGALAPEGTFQESLSVLGADTTVTLDHQILGKPADAADAARILRLLSGRTHHVITGVALVTSQSTQVAAESTAVRFLALSEQEIAAYIATGEPMGKAGAYAIQGRAARWIPRIEGCYFNVMGLPIALVSALLESRLPADLLTR